MNRPVLVIRPEPGASATVARAAAMGLKAMACPLARIEPLPWTVPDPDGFDALLLTSANAVRMAGDRISALESLPVWAVGERTAQAAREAGFRVKRTGQGGVAELLAEAPPAHLLHLGGEDRTPAPPGWDVMAIAVYANRLIAPPAEFAALLAAHPVILLHSARMAAHLASLCPDRSRIALAAISNAVAQAAGAGWQRLAVAAQSSDEALLDLARSLVAVDEA